MEACAEGDAFDQIGLRNQLLVLDRSEVRRGEHHVVERWQQPVRICGTVNPSKVSTLSLMGSKRSTTPSCSLIPISDFNFSTLIVRSFSALVLRSATAAFCFDCAHSAAGVDNVSSLRPNDVSFSQSGSMTRAGLQRMAKITLACRALCKASVALRLRFCAPYG
eukprot:CAMPEP_0176168114 /NCGR_PEP_ID=MMETSP0120_2-20121206/86034_1 /TAXON_ID=160619 /ORGANISM="Kryptoperidinium foliaceum, Strain CCMP 1326" /LENGTH=163 /DNA_ID=CAMNT_0017505801 /DNA_START=272 /DNA_END=759 /DNA_ORIENTATION=-